MNKNVKARKSPSPASVNIVSEGRLIKYSKVKVSKAM